MPSVETPAIVETPTDPLLGRTLAGKYLIQDQVRSGAMGTVYRAHHTSLDKIVCVKVMHPHLAVDGRFAKRFHREARAASRLDHPNSVHVLDFGEEPDGVLYIAMEFLNGRDLFELMKEDWPLAPERVADIFAQMLAALAAAHDAGILHRDLKPENIMIVKSGAADDAPDRVKVCDFGIAKLVEQDDDTQPESGRHLTTRGLVIGTPEYMSPEQARALALDARSDLYSVGAMLYEMLTGHPPFEAETPIEVALRQISEKPRSPSVVVPGVDKRLEAVCLRALEKEPSDRYASAREMRTAIRAAFGATSQLPRALITTLTPVEVPTSSRSLRPGPVTRTAETLAAPATTEPGTTTTNETAKPKARPHVRMAAIAVAVAALALGRWALGSRNQPAPPSIAAAAVVHVPTAASEPPPPAADGLDRRRRDAHRRDQ